MKPEETAAKPPEKTPYSAPKLHRFGEVSRLTEGVGGTNMDMGSMTMGMMAS